MKSSLLSSSLLLTALFSLTHQVKLYSDKISHSALYFSSAAYCAYDDLQAWSCGSACQGNPGFKLIRMIKNPNRDTFAYVGYVQSEDQVVLAFRGTNGKDFRNWMTNLDGNMILNPYDESKKSYVHKGFYEAYKDIAEEVRASVSVMFQVHPSAKLMITGHSLGGALSLLAALDIRYQLKLDPSHFILYTFGQPRVGCENFSNFVYQQLPPSYIRVTHYDDTVPHIPPSMWGLKHAGNEVWYPAEAYDGKYQECENFPFQTENDSCSNSLWIKAGVFSHLTYLGVDVTKQCNRNQPGGTLMEEDASTFLQ